MKKSLLCLCASLVAATAWAQPHDLLTRAERTDYVETSRYDDVMAFLEDVAARSPLVHLQTYGYTTEGRRMPLVVVGRVEGSDPATVRATGRLRVLLQGNIHGGEVEGKEALLELLREIAGGAHPAWADSLVLLVTPIFNADGNERIGLYNRPWQHGPIGGMGQRSNAQGLDLNRDHMKLASPEARAFVHLLNAYDPQVTVDLHTTDGSFHGYHLTYAPGLNPNTPDATTGFLRGTWLPEITQRVRERDSLNFYYYGNFDGYALRPQAEAPGWYTFDHRPRFNNNYVGLRSRLAILSEAYSYLPFESRVRVTKRFAGEILDFATAKGSAIRQAIAAAEREPVAGQPFAVRSRLAPPTTAEILVGEATEERNPFTGALMYRRADVAVPTQMLEYGTFEGEEWTTAPAAYLVPATATRVLELLRAHGIADAPATPGAAPVEVFRVDSVRVSERVFQDAREQMLFGAYERQTMGVPVGMRRVSVEGPLARLVVYLLEPRSDDGVVAWGLWGDELTKTDAYPVWRVPVEAGN